MKSSGQTIQKIAERRPWLGPVLWIASIRYFIVQAIAALSWNNTYSIQNNTISDLGNTVCGMYGDRFVCSPLHGLMNISFVTLGLSMVAGSILLYYAFQKTVGSLIGFGFLMLAGAGAILVGIFPENAPGYFHEAGAALPLFLGNAAVIILGLTLAMPRVWRYYSILSGVAALFMTAFILNSIYPKIGIGGIERVSAYPQTIWLIFFGIYVLSSNMKHQHYIWYNQAMDTIDEYLRNIDEPKRAELERIRKVVQDTAPDAAETISYGMPTFKYKGKPLIHFAAFKNHLSIFPTGDPMVHTLGGRLQKFRTSKGTLQFTLDDPISDALIKEIVKIRLASISKK